MERPKLFDYLTSMPLAWMAVASLGIVFLWVVTRQSHSGEIAGYSVSWIASAAALFLIYRRPITGPFVLTGRALAFLGQISYPLYLWHVAVLRLGEKYLPRYIGEGHGALQTLLIYMGAIVVALSVTTLIERPFMNYRDRILPPPVKTQLGGPE